MGHIKHNKIFTKPHKSTVVTMASLMIKDF